MAARIKILETFRDAVQGLNTYIPTGVKVEMINVLMEVGYDYLDAGSFVSSGIIPQFRDMNQVLDRINEPGKGTRLFVLVGNRKGAEKATAVPKVDIIGFPYSTSETFLRKNINKDFDAAWKSLCEVQDVCAGGGKELMVYLAMAFGNPYNDPVHADIVLQWVSKLRGIGVRHVHLSDITGVASPQQVSEYFGLITNQFPEMITGIHLHIQKDDWNEKIRQAYLNGCQIFDGVISGLGGCPMTGYEMVKNLPTSYLLKFVKANNLTTQIDDALFEKALTYSNHKLLSISTY